MLIVIVLLFGMVYECAATTIAGTGLLVSDPAIRNFLILTGLGYKVDQQGLFLYDLSGFRYLSEPTDHRRRNASTISHVVVEVDPRASPSSSRVKREHPFHVERQYAERLFNVLRNMERNTCISKLFCNIGYSPDSFGIIGRKIHAFLTSIPAVTWNSAASPYMEAFILGAVGEPTACSSYYGSCPYNLRRILPLLAPTF